LKKNKLRVAMVAAAAGLILLLTLSELARAQHATMLTPGDYIEIQQLVNRLNFALDYCGNGGRDFADLFIEGGQFIIDSDEGMPIVKSTRQELIALAGGPDSRTDRVGERIRGGGLLPRFPTRGGGAGDGCGGCLGCGGHFRLHGRHAGGIPVTGREHGGSALRFE